jgi:hypothetical protein
MTYSKAKLKSSGNKAYPCFRPFWVAKLTDKCLPIWTLLYVSFKYILISQMDGRTRRKEWFVNTSKQYMFTKFRVFEVEVNMWRAVFSEVKLRFFSELSEPCFDKMVGHNHVNYTSKLHRTKLNSVALVRRWTIPTEWPPLVDEVSANFCG